MKIKEELKLIKEEVIYCQKCPLYKAGTLPVVGQGNHWAKIMFVGEAPGATEAKTGRPFCGGAGKVFDELLMSIGIKREEIYITNVLKHQPPNNRNPSKEEITACSPYLDRQIKTINPEVICPMGNCALNFIFNKYGLKDKIQGISKIHGEIFEKDNLKIIPLYHPAVVAYNEDMKEVLKKDFQLLKNYG